MDALVLLLSWFLGVLRRTAETTTTRGIALVDVVVVPMLRDLWARRMGQS